MLLLVSFPTNIQARLFFFFFLFHVSEFVLLEPVLASEADIRYVGKDLLNGLTS